MWYLEFNLLFALFLCFAFPVVALLLYRELDEFQQAKNSGKLGNEGGNEPEVLQSIQIDPSHMNPIHPYAPQISPSLEQDTSFQSDLERELFGIWRKDVAQLPVCVDFPRLASRIEIIDTSSVSHNASSFPASPRGVDVNWMEIKRRELDAWSYKLLQLIKLFEQDPQKLNLVEDYISQQKENSIAGDGSITNLNLQFLTEEVILKILGNQSKTVRALKAINQEIIQPAVYRAKHYIFKATKQSTKDIHTVDGWRIFIQMKEDGIEILHERTEQSMLKTITDKQYFKAQWRLVMCFDRQLLKLLSAQVFVLQIDFHNNRSTNSQYRPFLGPVPSTDN